MRSNLLRRILGFLLIGAMMISLLGTSVFADDEDHSDELPSLPPMDEVEMPAGDPYGFADEDSQLELLDEASGFPAVYDMRELGYITPVRLQNPFGSCWAFAAIAAAESSILSSGLAAEDGLDASTLNLSERHLSIFTRTPIRDQNSSQYGEGFKDNGVPASRKLNEGGYAFMASNVFASGAGPVLENGDPDLIYQGRNGIIDYRFFDGSLQPFSYSADDDWDVPYSIRNAQSYTIKESYVLPTPAEVIDPGMGQEYWEYSYNEAATAAIKKQLMAGRAVEIGFLADQASPNQDEVEPLMLSPNWAHYGSYMRIANHAVTIVGWDDNYPKENFLENSQPPDDGAWLIKNSWGSGQLEFPNRADGTWGLLEGQDKAPYEATSDVHTGYFWLSYYDHSLSNPEAVEFERVDPSIVMDAYDYMGANFLNATEYEETRKMANTFFASQSERVTKISFQTTRPSTKVNWEIYLLDASDSSPDSGLLKAQGEEIYEFGGFHKVDLGGDSFPVSRGEYYSIVITETLPDGRYTVNVPVHTRSEYTGIINENESWLCMGEDWFDLGVDEDLQQELATDPTQDTLSPDDGPVYAVDNFSIKGYTVPLESNIAFTLSGNNMLKFVDKRDSATIKLRATNYGSAQSMADTGNWTIVWSLAEEVNSMSFTKDLVDITPSADGYSAKISTRKTEDGCVEGSSILCADVYAEDGEHLGTAMMHIESAMVMMEFVQLKNATEKFYYTGDEIRPEVQVYAYGSPGILLQETLEYTLSYEDNVECGVATVNATAAGDVCEGTVFMNYLILPAKAEIVSVTAGKGSMTVSIQDQSESGLDGYQIQYRKAGDTDWQSVMVDAQTLEKEITGLAGGEQYEVQVSGYIHVDGEHDWNIEDGDYPGLPSDIVTSDPIEQPDDIVTGWEKTDSGWVYHKDDGSLAKGWLQDSGKWYYMDPDSAIMQTGWIKVGTKWYFMRSSGAMATGWVKSGNTWYYMKASGAMASDEWVQADGTWYYLKASGAMAANEWCKGYWLNANGSWTYQPKGSWKKDSKGWWFGDTSGWYAKNTTIKIDNVSYTFDKNGYLVN